MLSKIPKPNSAKRSKSFVRGCVSIGHWASKILGCPNPMDKARHTQEAFQWLQNQSNPHFPQILEREMFDGGDGGGNGWGEVLVNRSRPEKPVLVDMKDMPSARSLGVSMNVYLLHGLAHIELNAIDAMWDTLLRFGGRTLMPLEFYMDMVSIANDESRHFIWLSRRLEANDSKYGSIPANGKIWKSIEMTQTDFKGRIAMIQLVHEPRALDSSDRLTKKFSSLKDHESQKLIGIICEEEIDHVKRGIKWFTYLCKKEHLDPITTFQHYLKQYNVSLPPPFNKQARLMAGMDEDWYLPFAMHSKPH